MKMTIHNLGIVLQKFWREYKLAFLGQLILMVVVALASAAIIVYLITGH